MFVSKDKITIDNIRIMNNTVHNFTEINQFIWVGNLTCYHTVKGSWNKHFKIVVGSILITIFITDNFTLLSQTDTVLNGTKWLRRNSIVWWATTTTDSTTTAMEEGNLNATLFTNLSQLILSFVKRPTWRQVTTIFVRVWVTQHDFLVVIAILNPTFNDIITKVLFHDIIRVFQVFDSFKKWNDLDTRTFCINQANFFKKDSQLKHIRNALSVRDNMLFDDIFTNIVFQETSCTEDCQFFFKNFWLRHISWWQSTRIFLQFFEKNRNLFNLSQFTIVINNISRLKQFCHTSFMNAWILTHIDCSKIETKDFYSLEKLFKITWN